MMYICFVREGDGDWQIGLSFGLKDDAVAYAAAYGKKKKKSVYVKMAGSGGRIIWSS